jgi:probable addiction module antidote protein
LIKPTTCHFVVADTKYPEEKPATLEACIEEADGLTALISKALGEIAQAQEMTQVARDSGLSGESLDKAFPGERSSSVATILKVVSVIVLKLIATLRSEAEVT